MAGNTFGTLFRVTTFGESHGKAIGCIVDGCPAGIDFDLDFIQHELDRRRPGQSAIVTQRKESDTVQVLSGIFDGKTTGTPIAMVIPNEDQRSKDYDHIAEAYRPSHADYTWQVKFGIRDHRGGGRSSARETAARVAAGALAKLALRQYGVSIQAYVSQVGELVLTRPYQKLDLSLTETNDIRCPDPELAEQMIALIREVRKDGDTIGGVVSAVIKGCPPGLGEPVFDKLHAELGKAMLSINAVKGFEYGSGFEGVALRGSAHNDAFVADLTTETQNSTTELRGVTRSEMPNLTTELHGGHGVTRSEMPNLTTELHGGHGVTRSETQNSKLKTQNPQLKTQNSKLKTQNPQLKTQNSLTAEGVPLLQTQTNLSGGVQGGISNGMDIYFRVAFKPVATIMQEQESVNAAGEPALVKGRGRHDPCVVPRAVPIVEAMAALVLIDHVLRQKAVHG